MGAKRLLRTLIFFALWLERDNHSCRLSMRTSSGSQASMTACKPGRASVICMIGPSCAPAYIALTLGGSQQRPVWT
jgi:hypothetical protein